MAKMYPKELPTHIRQDPLRTAECNVFDEFEKQLDDTFHVFYSSPWLGTTDSGEERDGEADFTIAHIEHGILVVEVKGGRVYVERTADGLRKWHSVDRNGIDFTIKNPVNQARDGKHNLLKALKERPECDLPYINVRHGVILNNVMRASHALGADMPLKIFAFAEDMNHLNKWVLSRFGCKESEEHQDRVKPLGFPGIMALKAMLSDGIELKVDLRTYLDSDVRKIEVLTEEQYGILEELQDNPRMAIAGAAGTGKTVLAAHKAWLEAKKGKPVLLVCFNEPLAHHLRTRLAEIDGVDVFSFHQLCEKTATDSGLRLPAGRKGGAEYFEKVLPNLFVSGLSRLPEMRYGSIVVDEGQDFADNWLETLELALVDSDDATYYVFFDNNQQVMSRAVNYIKTMKAARRCLRKNFRNTRKIFDVASRFYVGDGVVPTGPTGEPVQAKEVNSHSAAGTKLRESLGTLIAQVGVRPERVAVLCESRKIADQFLSFGKIASYPVTDASTQAKGAVVVDSIRRFKGLESDVVIVYMPEHCLDETEMLYVATTRAKALLIIIGTAGALSVINPQASG